MKSVNWSQNQATNLGFSLLETLIASTIFAAVLLIASSAFKFYMSIGNRAINSEKVMQEAIFSIQIRNTIKGLYHYYIKSQSTGSGESKKLIFHGESYGFSGVTLNGYVFPNQPANISISVLASEGDFKKLVLCEFDSKTRVPTSNIDVSCTSPVLIAENLRRAKFSYFGWTSVDMLFGVNTALNDLNSKVWSSTWNAELRGLLPQYIKIDLEHENNSYGYQPTQLWFQLADADPVQFKENNSNDF